MEKIEKHKLPEDEVIEQLNPQPAVMGSLFLIMKKQHEIIDAVNELAGFPVEKKEEVKEDATKQGVKEEDRGDKSDTESGEGNGSESDRDGTSDTDKGESE